jgi:hypothetical protein
MIWCNVSYYIDQNVKVRLNTTSHMHTNIDFLFDIQQATNDEKLMNQWEEENVNYDLFIQMKMI